MTCRRADSAAGRHEDITRVRAHPLAEPKAPPGRKDRRSRRALVLRTRRDSAGALVTGVCVELAAGQVVAERIVYAGQGPGTCGLCGNAPGAHGPGATRRILLVSACNLGRLLRDSGYRQGATVVGAGLAVEVAGLAEWWGPSRSRRGGWSFGLAGLGGPYGDRPWKLYADAPAVTASAVGDQVLLGWRGGREPKPKPGERRYRPLPRRGQFLDVLTVASALAGADVGDLAGACATFGLAPPGGDDLGDLDHLRARHTPSSPFTSPSWPRSTHSGSGSTRLSSCRPAGSPRPCGDRGAWRRWLTN